MLTGNALHIVGDGCMSYFSLLFFTVCFHLFCLHNDLVIGLKRSFLKDLLKVLVFDLYSLRYLVLRLKEISCP